MTHFVRFAMIGALIAGVSVYAIAQDDDLEALLLGLDDETVEEVEEASSDAVAEESIAGDEDKPKATAEAPVAEAEAEAEPPAAEAAEAEETPEVVAEADEPAAEEEVAEEPAAEEAAEEPAEVTAEEATDVPATEEATPEANAEVVDPAADEADDADMDDLLKEDEDEVADEPAVEAEPEAEKSAEEPAAAEETVTQEEPAEEVAPEAEEPAEELAEESETVVDVEPAAEEAAEDNTVTPAETETPAATEEATEEVTEEPVALEAEGNAEEKTDVEPLIPEEDDAEGKETLAAMTEEERKYNDLALLMELKNRGLDNHAYACLKKARELMTTPPPAGKAFDQYADAIKMYNDAKQFFREREENRALRVECDKGILEAEYRQAQALFDVACQTREREDFGAALEMAKSVHVSGHARGEALIALIQEEMNRPEVIRPTPVLPEYAKTDYKEKRLEVLSRMNRATVYYNLAKYKEANDQLELILREDPNNEEAINLRLRIEKRHSERNRQLKLSTHTEMINQVEANWTPLSALARNSEELYRPTESKGTMTKVDRTGEKEASIIMAKLEYIRLPEFTIRPPSTLADAVQLFAELAKAYDKPELPPEERGIAFVLNLGKATAAAAAASSDDDDFSDSDASASGLPPVPSLSMPWVTLKEALEMVCEVTDTSYVVKGKSIMIVPKNYVSGKMVTRSYNVSTDFEEKLLDVLGSDGGDGGSDGGWGSDDDDDSSSSAGFETYKRAFIAYGVPFEGDAKIVHMKKMNKIRVTNTEENLALLADVLDELNVTASLIEVEVRFVEVSQEDLNSLGFEWQLNSDIVGTVGSGIDWASSAIKGNASGGLTAGGTGVTGSSVFRNNAQSGTGKANVAMHGGALNQGMRFLGDGDTYANRINLSGSSIAPDDTFASFSAVFGKLDMTMILHMLAQRTDSDMLSSPKVLVMSGEEASIKVITEHRYPQDFDIQELDVANNYNSDDAQATSNMAPEVKFAVEPQNFTFEEVGVMLNVIPLLDNDGQRIELQVDASIVEYLGDYDYGMKVPYVEYGFNLVGDVTSAEVKYYTVAMPQPKFHRRNISTKLSIYNGATIAMGGLITETRNSFEDKVPILGDLPFIGFLFRSKGEYSEKRNLLIFLTTRLVDYSGRPLRSSTDGRMVNASEGTQAETMGASAND